VGTAGCGSDLIGDTIPHLSG